MQWRQSFSLNTIQTLSGTPNKAKVHRMHIAIKHKPTTYASNAGRELHIDVKYPLKILSRTAISANKTTHWRSYATALETAREVINIACVQAGKQWPQQYIFIYIAHVNNFTSTHPSSICMQTIDHWRHARKSNHSLIGLIYTRTLGQCYVNWPTPTSQSAN